MAQTHDVRFLSAVFMLAKQIEEISSAAKGPLK
jgi:hypothetical protein